MGQYLVIFGVMSQAMLPLKPVAIFAGKYKAASGSDMCIFDSLSIAVYSIAKKAFAYLKILFSCQCQF